MSKTEILNARIKSTKLGKEYDCLTADLTIEGDGWGRPIYHFECDKCHNLDAGAMSIVGDDPDDIEKYIQSVIEMYQGIRGIKIYIDESGENNASE